MKKLALVILLFSGALWALQLEIDLHANPSDSTAISSEWKLLEFLSSYESIDKQIKVGVCYAKGDDSAQCDKILDTWRESCERGEEKYCIGILAIHSKTDYGNYFILDSLGAVKRNCDNGMAGSCHAVGEYYYDIYLESPNDKKASSMLESALLYLQKSCDLGMSISCIHISLIYEHLQDTEQVKIYTDKARRIVDKDCKAGVKIACEFKEDVLD